MIVSLALIVLDIVISVAGQLMLKAAMNQVGSLGERIEQLGLVGALVYVFTTPLVIVAIGMYAFAFLFWIVALSRLHLSFAYPLLAATYVIIPVASWLLLGEYVPAQRWVGIAIITGGIMIVGRS